MSEGSGPIVGNVYESGRWCEGSVGKPYPGVEVELKNKTADGEGEVSHTVVIVLLSNVCVFVCRCATGEDV